MTESSRPMFRKKNFIMRCFRGKFPGQVDIAYTDLDLELMHENLKDGVGRLYLKWSERTGNPYCELIVPRTAPKSKLPPQTMPDFKMPPEPQWKDAPTAIPKDEPEPKTEDVGKVISEEDLPF